MFISSVALTSECGKNADLAKDSGTYLHFSRNCEKAWLSQGKIGSFAADSASIDVDARYEWQGSKSAV
jgi:hypothetical protein